MPTHCLRAAVLGTGAMGQRHLQALAGLPVEVVALADVSPQALTAAKTIGTCAAAREFTDPVQLLRTVRPDLVVVSTTAPGHAPLTIEAARCGARYILCEKPMATSLADCDAMLAACAQHGALLAINHGNRALSHYQELRKRLADGILGAWRSVTLVMGNGGLANNATHYIDLFHFLAQERIAEVTAWVSPEAFPNPRGPRFVDYGGMARMATASGRRLLLEMSADLGCGVLLVFAGTCGRLIIDELAGHWQLTTRRPGDWALPTTRYATPVVSQGWDVGPSDPVRMAQGMLARLLQGETLVSGEDGRAAIAVLMAMHYSSQYGQQSIDPAYCPALTTMVGQYA